MSNHLTIHDDKHEKMTASLKLLSQLAEGEESAKEHGWYGLPDATASLLDKAARVSLLDKTARALLAEPKATRKKA